MKIRKAQRQQSKLRIGVSWPSGAWKTYSALLLARGITGDWAKIGVIDTENGSADLYSHLGDFSVISLEPPFTPERYIEAIEAFEESGVEVIIIDSVTHEWDWKGGLLEANERVAQTKFKWNTWSAWSVTTPRHQNFIDAITHSKCHIITTARSKTETVQVDGKIKKLGMKDIQREGFEYELTVAFNIDRDFHLATASKDRTGLFIDNDAFVISEKTGEIISEWNKSGAEVKIPPTDTELFEKFDTLLKECTTLEELKNCFFEIVKAKNTLGENFYKALESLKDDMKASLTSKQDVKNTIETIENVLDEMVNEVESAVGKLGKKAKEENEAILGSEEFKEVFGDETQEVSTNPTK